MGQDPDKRQELPQKKKRGTKTVARIVLFPDEDVVMSATPGRLTTIPKYIFTLGLYEIWRRRNVAVVTNQRILFGSGVVQRTEKSIPLKRVMDVAFTRRGANSYAEVAVNERGKSSVRRVGPMTGSTARRFVNEVLRRT